MTEPVPRRSAEWHDGGWTLTSGEANQGPWWGPAGWSLLSDEEIMIRHDSTEARAERGKQKAAIARQIARYCSSGRATIRQLAQVLGYSQQMVFQAAKEYGFAVQNDGLATWVAMPKAADVIPHTPPEWVQRMRNAPAYRRMLGAF